MKKSHYNAQNLFHSILSEIPFTKQLIFNGRLKFEDLINEAQSKLFGKEVFKVDSLKEVEVSWHTIKGQKFHLFHLCVTGKRIDT